MGTTPDMTQALQVTKKVNGPATAQTPYSAITIIIIVLVIALSINAIYAKHYRIYKIIGKERRITVVKSHMESSSGDEQKLTTQSTYYFTFDSGKPVEITKTAFTNYAIDQTLHMSDIANEVIEPKEKSDE